MMKEMIIAVWTLAGLGWLIMYQPYYEDFGILRQAMCCAVIMLLAPISMIGTAATLIMFGIMGIDIDDE